jgi:phosphoglycolate phosphatase
MTPADAEIVFCDLDGTIVDSYPGIYRCLRFALPEVGLGHLTDDQIRAILGPPLHYSLKEVHGKSDEDVDRFVVKYRSVYFGGGEYEFDIFPGMEGLLRDVATSDRRLVLATAKPIESAVRVLTKAGLLDLFDAISGSELDLQRQGKEAVIAHGLDLINAEPGSPSVMIGDRKEDVIGAKAHDFMSIAVAWGYADGSELVDAQPDVIVDDALELRRVLGL